MTHRSVAPIRRSYHPRRFRRRRRLVLLMVLGTLISLVVLAVRYRTEERQTTDYTATAHKILVEEAVRAERLCEVLTDLGNVERQDLLGLTQDLAVESSAANAALNQLDVPGSVAKAHAFLDVALGSWNAGWAAVDDSILTVLDSGRGDPTGEAMLGAVFVDLQVGDRAYQRFLQEQQTTDRDSTSVESFPTVQYVEGKESLCDAAAIVTLLRAARNLGERHAVAVTARTEPEPLGTRDGHPVVPSSESLTVLAVVSNDGNAPEVAIEVTLELVASDGSEPAIERSHLVDRLDPGDATTVDFSELTVEDDRLYKLSVTTSIVDDSNPQRGTFEMSFFTSPAQ